MATLTERLSTFLYHPCNRSDISSATLIFRFKEQSCTSFVHYKHTDIILNNLEKSQFILS